MKFSKDEYSLSSVGHCTFDKETSTFEDAFFLEGYADYIPVGAIVGDGNTQYGLDMGAEYGSKGAGMMRRLEKQYPGLYRIDKRHAYDVIGRVNNLSRFASAMKIAVEAFLEPSDFGITRESGRYSRAKYEDLLRAFFGSMTKQYYFQSTRGITVGAGYVYHRQSKDFIFCMVIPTRLIKYFKLHFMLEGSFPTEGVEFWVKKGFDTPKTLYKGFRGAYRKLIKPKIQELDIPFHEKTELAVEMMPTIAVPESIDELKKWKKDLVAKALKHERENTTFNF